MRGEAVMDTEAHSTSDTTPLADEVTRLRAVVASVSDAIVIIDARGIIETVNPACARMFGHDAEALVGRNVSVLMAEPYRAHHDAYVARFVTSGEARIVGRGQREVEALRADGSTVLVELAVTELTVSGRRLFLGVLRDISQRKRAELDHTSLVAREANRRGRVEVSSGIVRDLGNALTGISARAADLQAVLARAGAEADLPRTARFVRAHREKLASALGAPKADALGDLLDAIAAAHAASQSSLVEGTAKLSAFVAHAQDLLAIHRAQSGVGSGPATSKVSAQSLLLDVQTMMSDAVARRGGRLVVSAGSDLRGVEVDGVRVLRAVIHAVKNATEAYEDGAPGGPLEVSVVVSRVGDTLQIAVRDNGPGFAGSGEACFADGYSTKARGSGQGLGAAREAVAPLGGVVTLTSDGPGRGALFTLTLEL